ncbi:MAG TPA: hypothetical protein VFX16_16955 [Pseudonocardiaceae bacterium]|nr:hypothetical protein [Pseudonocardiaceae bacterium]
MSKNMLPMKSGGGLLSKMVTILIALAVLALVVQHPSDAATWVVSVVRLLGRVIAGISTFLRSMLG